jgi:hypothetical protein
MREHSPERTRVAEDSLGKLEIESSGSLSSPAPFSQSRAVSFFAFLRSHAATLSIAERHLVDVASSLIRDYTAHAASLGLEAFRSQRREFWPWLQASPAGGRSAVPCPRSEPDPSG